MIKQTKRPYIVRHYKNKKNPLLTCMVTADGYDYVVVYIWYIGQQAGALGINAPWRGARGWHTSVSCPAHIEDEARAMAERIGERFLEKFDIPRKVYKKKKRTAKSRRTT